MTAPIALDAPTLSAHVEAAPSVTPEARRALVKLTPDEKQVIELLAAGGSSASIARTLDVSEGAIDRCVRRLYGRTATKSRPHLVATALRYRWIR